MGQGLHQASWAGQATQRSGAGSWDAACRSMPVQRTASKLLGGSRRQAVCAASCGGLGEANAAAACPPRRRGLDSKAVAPAAAARSPDHLRVHLRWRLKQRGRLTGQDGANGQSSCIARSGAMKGCLPGRPDALATSAAPAAPGAGRGTAMGLLEGDRPDAPAARPVMLYGKLATTLVGGRAGTASASPRAG